MIAIDVACNNFSWVSSCEKWDPNAEQRLLGDLVLLIKRAPFELEMIKKGSSARGSGVSSGLAGDHSKDTDRVCAVSKLGIIADATATQPLLFIQALRWTIHKFATRLQLSALLFFISLPWTRSCNPLEPLQMLVESWEINAPTLGWEELGLGQFGLVSYMNYSFARRGRGVLQRISRLYHITALISET